MPRLPVDTILDAAERVQKAGLNLGRKIQAAFLAQVVSNDVVEVVADNEMIELAEAVHEYDVLTQKQS